MDKSFEEHLAADARLTILKALADETDGRLNEVLLSVHLDRGGYRKSREWLRTQLRALEDVNAITLMDAGSVMIAAITRAGVDHVERRTVIEGIARPAPEF